MTDLLDEVALRPITRSDESAIRAFVQDLPEVDQLFTRRDLTEPRVIEAWLDAIDAGEIHSDLALRDDTIVGFNALVTQPKSWSSHVGEIRVMVSERQRRLGVGRALADAVLTRAIELGLKKLTASMTVDQRSAIALFEGMGFRGEALLRDHVQTKGGERFDLAIFSHDVAEAQLRRSMLGMEG
ncbi:MAG: GNAT family N-acetyltransferase [Pseudomonadota bacterium]